MRHSTDRGIALIALLLLTTLMVTVALGLSLILSTEHLVVRNTRESAALGLAAAAGVEMAARALEFADWNALLAGALQADGADGPPSGTRPLGGGDILDLDLQTNVLNCASGSPCDATQLRAVTEERPWGPNNPTWRLFLYGPLERFAAFQHAPRVYVMVWVADDSREIDGDPQRDGVLPEPGAGILILRSVAVGPFGGRRGFEAEAVRICRPGPGRPVCQPGIRVQSWRDLRWSVP